MRNNLLRKLVPIVAVGAVSLGALIGCEVNTPTPPQLPPGPIYVQSTITPTTIPNGSSATFTVTVDNIGFGEATISEATYHEVCISGWAKGSYDVSGNLPITTNKIPARTTETIFSISKVLINYNLRNPTDLVYEDTINIKSDGGDDQTIVNYTVLH